MTTSRSRRGAVLLVVDADQSPNVVAHSVRQEAQVWVARSPSEAHSVLRDKLIDVLIVDDAISDGRADILLRYAAKHYPSAGRILLNDHSNGRDIVDAAQSGLFDRFFWKPYSIPHLRAALLELLRQRGIATAPRVLVADDSVELRQRVCECLKAKSIDVVEATDGAEAIKFLGAQYFDAAVVDVWMPVMDGTKVLDFAQQKDPDLPVLILTTAEYSVGINFLEAGAFDFMSKPVNDQELLMRVQRMILARQQSADHRRLIDELHAAQQAQTIISESDGMKRVLEQANSVATHDVNVLVSGDTGVGKEVVARYVHQVSRRAEGPFIPINCGALPETLAESELFGHDKGAFTDAKKQRAGVFEAADGGTVFLDEVGELTPQSQVRLLRTLENREVTRVGSTKAIQVDVRVIAATNRDLSELISEGQFRQDLYYRLNAFRIDIPPLRERDADIGPLIEQAVRTFCLRNKALPPEISAGALEQARSYGWPGNVRQLVNVVQRALITHGTRGVIEQLDLEPISPAHALKRIDYSLPLDEALQPIFDAYERNYLETVLKMNGEHIGRTATHTGIHRKSLYNRMKRHAIKSRRRPRGASST